MSKEISSKEQKIMENVNSYLTIWMYDHNATRHRQIENWLDGNLSNRFMNEELGIKEYDY